VTDLDDQSGSTLGERFRLVKQLGRGGMGAVYLAEDLSVPLETAGREVAVKLIKANLIDDEGAIKRFAREAVTIGKLTHPHIVAFRGTGDVAGVHWLAMEYLRGQTLRQRIETGGPLPWRQSLDVVQQVTSALAAAHAQGVLHRDLKPDNVMLLESDDPRAQGSIHVKLLDFGIAKQIDAEAMTMTGTGLIVGTPGFIAPEVIVGGPNDDPRADLYALGALWFEMVTATKPFEASTPFALAMKHVQEAPPRPNAVRPFSPIPLPVEDAILRLLEKRPEARPRSAMALQGVLDHLINTADNPPEPSSSTLRTTRDLGASQATETGFTPLSPIPPTKVGQTQPLGSTPGRMSGPDDLAPSARTLGDELESSAPTMSAGLSSRPILAPVPAPRSKAPIAIVAGVAVVVIILAAVVTSERRESRRNRHPEPVPVTAPAPPPPPVAPPPVAEPPPVVAPAPPPVAEPPPVTPVKPVKIKKKPKLLLDE